MVDGVLLDWEGVLADTGRARRDALRRALTDEGVPFDETAYDERWLGRSVRAAAADAIGALHADPTLVDLIALRAQREFTATIGQGFALRAGAARFCELAQLRAPVAIVTCARRVETDIALRLAGLADSFTACITADDVLAEMPSPEAFELALAHLARRRPVRRAHVIALASTHASLLAARSTRIRTVAVGLPAHEALDADAAIPSLASLGEIRVDELAALTGVDTERFA